MNPQPSRSSPLTLLVRQRTGIFLWALKLSNSFVLAKTCGFRSQYVPSPGSLNGFCDLKPLRRSFLYTGQIAPCLDTHSPRDRKSVTISHVAVYSTQFQPQQRLYKVLGGDQRAQLEALELEGSDWILRLGFLRIGVRYGRAKRADWKHSLKSQVPA